MSEENEEVVFGMALSESGNHRMTNGLFEGSGGIYIDTPAPSFSSSFSSSCSCSSSSTTTTTTTSLPSSSSATTAPSSSSMLPRQSVTSKVSPRHQQDDFGSTDFASASLLNSLSLLMSLRLDSSEKNHPPSLGKDSATTSSSPLSSTSLSTSQGVETRQESSVRVLEDIREVIRFLVSYTPPQCMLLLQEYEEAVSATDILQNKIVDWKSKRQSDVEEEDSTSTTTTRNILSAENKHTLSGNDDDITLSEVVKLRDEARGRALEEGTKFLAAHAQEGIVGQLAHTQQFVRLVRQCILSASSRLTSRVPSPLEPQTTTQLFLTPMLEAVERERVKDKCIVILDTLLHNREAVLRDARGRTHEQLEAHAQAWNSLRDAFLKCEAAEKSSFVEEHRAEEGVAQNSLIKRGKLNLDQPEAAGQGSQEEKLSDAKRVEEGSSEEYFERMIAFAAQTVQHSGLRLANAVSEEIRILETSSSSVPLPHIIYSTSPSPSTCNNNNASLHPSTLDTASPASSCPTSVSQSSMHLLTNLLSTSQEGLSDFLTELARCLMFIVQELSNLCHTATVVSRKVEIYREITKMRKFTAADVLEATEELQRARRKVGKLSLLLKAAEMDSEEEGRSEGEEVCEKGTGNGSGGGEYSPITLMRQRRDRAKQKASEMRLRREWVAGEYLRAAMGHFPELRLEAPPEFSDWFEGASALSIESYDNVRKLDQSVKGYSSVLRAERSGKEVVLKKFRLESWADTQRMLREVRALKRLRHPHIISIEAVFFERKESGEARGYLQLPYYEDGDLVQWLQAHQPSDELLRNALRCVALALAHMHRNGIVHCDVKPQNIFVRGGVAVLGDFDVSKDQSSRTTTTAGETSSTTRHSWAGHTEAYVAPEVYSGHISPAIDIYAFGLTVYDCHNPPDTSSTSYWAYQRPRHGLIKAVPHGPKEIIMQCTLPTPESRPTALELLSNAYFAEGGGTDERCGSEDIPIQRSCVICDSVCHLREGALCGDEESMEKGQGEESRSEEERTCIFSTKRRPSNSSSNSNSNSGSNSNSKITASRDTTSHFYCCQCLTHKVRAFASATLDDLVRAGGRFKCDVPLCEQGFSSARVAAVVLARDFDRLCNQLMALRELGVVKEFEERVEDERRLLLAHEKQNSTGEKNGVSSNGGRGSRSIVRKKSPQEHRNRIVDEILTLACPRCRQAFIDYNDCLALICGRCGAGFCGACMLDCGRDAHLHAVRCPSLPPGSTIYANEATFCKIQTARRQRLLNAYFVLNLNDPKLAEEVRELIRVDVESLHLVLPK